MPRCARITYRDDASPPPPACTELCASRGAPSQLAARDESFTCGRCGISQAAVRGGEVTPRRSIEAVAQVEAGHGELVPFAESVRVQVRCAQITVRCDGVDSDVAVDRDSGVVRGVTLHAHTDRFARIMFTASRRSICAPRPPGPRSR